MPEARMPRIYVCSQSLSKLACVPFGDSHARFLHPTPPLPTPRSTMCVRARALPKPLDLPSESFSFQPGISRPGSISTFNPHQEFFLRLRENLWRRDHPRRATPPSSFVSKMLSEMFGKLRDFVLLLFVIFQRLILSWRWFFGIFKKYRTWRIILKIEIFDEISIRSKSVRVMKGRFEIKRKKMANDFFLSVWNIVYF